MTRHPVIHSGYKIHGTSFGKLTRNLDNHMRPEESCEKQEKNGRKVGTYWRNNFILVLAPFELIGVPVQALIPANDDEDSIITNPSIGQWLKFHFRSTFVALLTVLQCPIWIGINYWFFSPVVSLLDHIVLQGRLEVSDVPALVELVYSLPFFIMVNYMWFYGHIIRAFIQSLDVPHLFESYVAQPWKAPEENLWIDKNNGYIMVRQHLLPNAVVRVIFAWSPVERTPSPDAMARGNTIQVPTPQIVYNRYCWSYGPHANRNTSCRERCMGFGKVEIIHVRLL